MLQITSQVWARARKRMQGTLRGLRQLTDLKKGLGEGKVRRCERDWAAQRRAQKNFFSRKGFSEVGTGVMRGSSQAWASQ